MTDAVCPLLVKRGRRKQREASMTTGEAVRSHGNAQRTRPVGRVLRLLLAGGLAVVVVPYYRAASWQQLLAALAVAVGLLFIYNSDPHCRFKLSGESQPLAGRGPGLDCCGSSVHPGRRAGPGGGVDLRRCLSSPGWISRRSGLRGHVDPGARVQEAYAPGLHPFLSH